MTHAFGSTEHTALKERVAQDITTKTKTRELFNLTMQDSGSRRRFQFFLG